MPVAAIFGSSLASADDRCCRLAFDLGAGLARLGFSVKNGGYGGVMEAASRGAREAGGQVIGVTVGTLAAARTANPYLTRELREPDLHARLRTLVAETDIFFAVESGGPGTLNEVFLVWALAILGELKDRPLVLLGEGWPDLIDLVREQFSVGPEMLKPLRLAADVPAALEVAAAHVRG